MEPHCRFRVRTTTYLLLDGDGIFLLVSDVYHETVVTIAAAVAAA